MIPKFRAWDTFDEDMVNDIFFSWQDCGYESLNECLSDERWKFMQSTGLFDTFRQDELFEDDVILWTYFDEWEDSGKARIVYRDGCWKLLDIKTGKEAWDSLFDCLENCTVFLCGNIHENPELMEAEND
ncbi:TPA: YopX family protein [Streptococcus suis]